MSTDLDRVLAGLGLVRDDLPGQTLAAIERHLDGADPLEPLTMNDRLRGRGQLPGIEQEPATDAPTTDAAVDVLRLRVGDELGLHPEVRALLRGSTYDQLTADAYRLADLFATVKPPTPSTAVPSGPRGTEHELSGAEQVNAMLRSATGRTFE